MWWKQIPNAVTLSRFPLGALFVILHSGGYVLTGLCVATLMCLSDGLDGYLARRWSCVSEFGTRIEPFADRWTYGSIIAVVMTSMDWHAALLPAVLLLSLYELLVFVAWALLRQTDIRTNLYAKRRTACIMCMALALYGGIISGSLPAVFPFAVLLGYAAGYYAIRSVIAYVRERGLGEWIPRPFHLL